MDSWIDRAKGNIHSWVSGDSGSMVVEVAKAEALIAIAEELAKLNAKLDELTDKGEYPGLRVWPYGVEH